MKRRDFLRNTGLGLGLAALPALIRDGFAASAADPELLALSDTWRLAGERGKPVLVLVIPEDEGDRWARGRAFGAWLNNASATSLAQLALCEVICARPSQLATLLPDVPANAVMVLADPKVFPAEPRIAAPHFPDADKHNSWEEEGRVKYEAAIDRQIALLEKSLDDLIEPFVPTDFAARKKRLAAEASARFVGKRIPGSYWASNWGCGTDIEEYDEMYGIGCGMGHVSAKATRFLYFFDPASGYM
ncbi:MAG: hypothetical protein GY913_31590 [Proteobacteria bacterium]|nr:hypothetical protein [Pseudomonadota bacterium]MCP4921464.1 hypothetical protein [Pseudomonadota bacterium]